MDTNIKKRWHRLEHKRILLMQELSKSQNDVLNQQPNAQKWSATQVIIHLMRAESASLAYMKKKLSHGSILPKAGFKSKMRLLMLNIAFYLPLKFKAPPILEENLPSHSDFNALKNDWASQRLELQEFIDSLPDNVIESEIWNHPYAGKMNIAQMIDFFESHFDRHKKQIQKTLKMVSV
jgi:DinB superfamily